MAVLRPKVYHVPQDGGAVDVGLTNHVALDVGHQDAVEVAPMVLLVDLSFFCLSAAHVQRMADYVRHHDAVVGLYVSLEQ